MFAAQLLANGLLAGTQVLLIAVALYLVYAVSRAYHLALGAIAAAAAYASFAVLSGGGSWAAAVFVSFVVVITLSLASYGILEPFNRTGRTHESLLASFAFGVVIESVISIWFGTDGKNLTVNALEPIAFGGVILPWSGVLTVIIGLVLAIVAAVVVLRTPGGRVLRSIAENPAVTQSLGVDGRRIRAIAFVAAGLLAGAIGICLGLNTALTPLMGFQPLIMAFIALLVGGTGSLRGLVVACYALALIPEFLIGYAPESFDFTQSWRMALVFLVAAVCLAIRPRGLFVRVSRSV